jgi:uncharacterized protein YbaP (TraB family)
MATRQGRYAMSRRRAVLAAALCCAAASARGDVAGCGGRDLFPILEARAPETFAAIETDARAMPFAHGTLFRVSREGIPPSYVFGTLHLSDPRVVSFRQAVITALDSSKTVALESVETGAKLTQSIRKNPAAMRAALLARPDQRAGALLSKPDFTELENVTTAAALTPSSANTLKPAILALLLDLPHCARTDASHPYADALIGEMGRARGHKVIGLETMIEQVAILDGLPPDVERALLIATVRQAAHAEDVVETTIARYVDQDTGALLTWMKSPNLIPGVLDARTPPEFLDRLISQRNLRLRDRLLPLLAKGSVFIAVGAAHLPGEDGLLHLIETAGYKVEPIE